MKDFLKDGGCAILFIPSMYVLGFFLFFLGSIKETIKHQLIFKAQQYESIQIIDSVTVRVPATQFSEASVNDYFVLEDSERILKTSNHKIGDTIKRAFFIDTAGVKHLWYLYDNKKVSKPTWTSYIPFFLFPLILFIPVIYFLKKSIKKIHTNVIQLKKGQHKTATLRLFSYYLDAYFVLFVGYLISIALFFSAYTDILIIEDNSVLFSSLIIFSKIIISVYIPIILVSVVKHLNDKKMSAYWAIKILLRIVGYGSMILSLIQFMSYKSIEDVSVFKLFIFVINCFKKVF